MRTPRQGRGELLQPPAGVRIVVSLLSGGSLRSPPANFLSAAGADYVTRLCGSVVSGHPWFRSYDRRLTRTYELSMVSHMKTTISIADDLLEKAKTRARQENKTLREVVEEALRLHLTQNGSRNAFRLKRHAFKGKGLQPGIDEGNWEQLRDLIYGSG